MVGEGVNGNEFSGRSVTTVAVAAFLNSHMLVPDGRSLVEVTGVAMSQNLFPLAAHIND